MVQSFQERFITREEHQRIVDYYRKLVARLYGNVGFEAQAEAPVKKAPQAAERPGGMPQEKDLGLSVVHLGFYRDRRKSGA